MERRPRGAITGLPSLDMAFGGALPAGLTIMHGLPGSGKSALALQIAADCGCPSLYVTVEMSVLELARRTVARVTSTPLSKIKWGDVTPDESLELLHRTVEAVPQMVFADATRDYATIEWLRKAAMGVRGGSEHFLMVIDSVHSWADSGGSGTSEYDRLGQAIRDLQELAAILECPVLGVAERNREKMKDGGVSAAAGTRKFEYGSEVVIDLQPDGDVNASGERPVKMKLAKNRHGEQGRNIDLFFNGSLQRYQEPGTCLL